MPLDYRRYRSAMLVLIAVLIPFLRAGRASADYVVHDLYSITGGDVSSTFKDSQGAVGRKVVGLDNSSLHALLWEGAGSPTPLDDSVYTASFAIAIGGDQVVGAGAPDAQHADTHALLWTGSTHTLVDLHPTQLGFASSLAAGTSGSEQVGSGSLQSGGASHALLWHNTAGSVVDLHPSNFDSSAANATDGIHQVGSGSPAGSTAVHALLWTGTATSAVDLDPAGAFSAAYGVSGNAQVGEGIVAPGEHHALLWHGTAASVVDLQPAFAGDFGSVALATNGTQEVGYLSPVLMNPFAGRAVAWGGTAASAVDLQALLPADFSQSWAVSIDSQGNVFGFGLDDADGTFHAVEWSPTPEPSVLALAGFGIALLRHRRNGKSGYTTGKSTHLRSTL